MIVEKTSDFSACTCAIRICAIVQLCKSDTVPFVKRVTGKVENGCWIVGHFFRGFFFSFLRF